MKIDRLALLAFGHLTNISLDLSATPHQFHLIVGENESGKSTTMRAIRSWLYGFDVQTRDDYVHLKKDMRVGGVLSSSKGTLACVRRKRNKDSLLDGNDPDQVIHEGLMTDFLFGVDKNTFMTQFALDHSELTRGGISILEGHGELGELLFAAGAGLGRLRNLQTELQKDVDGLLKQRGKSILNEQIKSLKERRGDLKSAQVPPAEFGKLKDEYEAKEDEIDQVRKALSTSSRRKSQLQAMINAKPIVTDWTGAKSKLKPLAEVPRLTDDFTTRRREVMGVLAHARESLAQSKSQLKQRQSELDELGEASKIIGYQDEIKEVLLELHSHEKNENERVNGLKKLLEKYQQDLKRGFEDLADQDCVTASADRDASEDVAIDDQIRKYQLSTTKRNRITNLAGEHGAIANSVEEAKQQISRIEQKIASITMAIDALPEVGQSAIERALDQIGSTKLLADDYRKALADYDAQHARCQKIVQRLGDSKDADDWSATKPPDPAETERLEKDLSQIESNLVKLHEEREDMRQEIADVQAELEAVRQHTTLPTINELDELRSRRNRELNRLASQRGVLAGGDFSSADREKNSDDDAFDSAMELVRQADELADRMKQYQKEVLQEEHLNAKVATLQSKVQRCEQKIANANEQLEDLKSKWQQVWQTVGVVAASPSAMKAWVDDHSRLIDQHDGLQTAKAELIRSQNAIRSAVQRLRDVLDDRDGEEDGDPIQPLVRLSDLAVGREEKEADARRQLETLRNQLQTHEVELEEAKLRLNQRETTAEKWRNDWSAATQDLAVSSPSPGDVLPMLDMINDLTAIMDDRDRTHDMMTTTEDETRAYLQRVQRLLESVGETPSKNSITDSELDTRALLLRAVPLISSLDERAKQENQNAAARKRIEAEIRELEALIGKQTANVKSHEVMLGSLQQEAGGATIDQLPSIEDQSVERRTIETQMGEAERELARLADGESIDAFIARVEASDTNELEDQLRDVTAEEAELSKQYESLIGQRGGLKELLGQIDGGEEAITIAQDIATRIGRIGEDAEKYIQLKIASAILKRSIEHYRSENQAPVLKIARDYFRRLTCYRYKDLKVDYDDGDVPVLHGIRDDGVEVPVMGMSDGTADSLYLAFRLASLRHRCESSEPMPLIVDDCLLNLDDRRVLAAMEVLSDLSQTTQIIMFSHHEFIANMTTELQEANQLHVHRLGV